MIGNASLHSSADDLSRTPVSVWIHEHMHYNVGFQYHGVSVITNQFISLPGHAP